MFEKLREAALAYHLTRRWPKEKIITEYLNSIYFGNGAYGVESAARVYFGKVHGYNSAVAPGQASSGCGDAPRHSCASMLTPDEAALLAGMVADPSAFDPLANPRAAYERRKVVLKDMLQLHYLSLSDYQKYVNKPLPTERRPPAPAGAGRGAVLHELAATADPGRDGAPPRRAAERGRVPGLLRRAEDPNHARPPAPAGGRSGHLAGAANRGEPAQRLAGGDRQQDRSGPGDGRRADRRRAGGLQPVPVQPGHAGTPAAGIVVQAVHAGDGAQVGRVRPDVDHRLRPAGLHRAQTAAARSTSSSTTSATPTRGRSRWLPPPTSPTTRCTRRWGSTSAPRRSPLSPAAPGSARPSRTTTR